MTSHNIAESEMQAAKAFSFPLKTFQKTRWEPYLTLQDFESIKQCDSYVFGTSVQHLSTNIHCAGNELVLGGLAKQLKADLVVNANTGILHWNDKKLERESVLSLMDLKFINHLCSKASAHKVLGKSCSVND